MSDIGTARRISAYYDASYPPDILIDPDDPHIVSLVPASASAAGGAVVVTVNGSRFDADAAVEIDQIAQPTTFVSENQLTVSYDPSVAGTVAFSVRNVAAAEESNSVGFTVATVTADDVSSWTIDAVKAFVVEHPSWLSEVTGWERGGKNRVTLVEWLQALLDEEDPEEPTPLPGPGDDDDPPEVEDD